MHLGHDRAGLERLLCYCARPPFALERIEQDSEDRIVYRLQEPQRDGRTALSLAPLEFINHLAALIPPPRLHRHRYHGVLAPNTPLRLLLDEAAIAAGDLSPNTLPAARPSGGRDHRDIPAGEYPHEFYRASPA